MRHHIFSLAVSAIIGSSLLGAAHSARAADAMKLEVGISGAATDVGFFIADKKGYF